MTPKNQLVPLVFACLLGIVAGKMMFNDVQTVAKADVRFIHHGRSRRDTGNVMPSTLDFHIETKDGHSKSLRLKRRASSQMPKVRVTRGTKTVDYTAKLDKTQESFAHYQDVNNGAAIMLKRSADRPSDFHAFGSYVDNSKKFAIESTFEKKPSGEIIHEVGELKAPRMDLPPPLDVSQNGQNGKGAHPENPFRVGPSSQDAVIEVAYYIGTTEYNYLETQDFVQNFTSDVDLLALTNTTGVTGFASFSTVAFLLSYVGYLNNEVDLRLHDFERDATVISMGNYTLEVSYSYLHIFASKPSAPSNMTVFWEDSIESIGKLTAANFLENGADMGYRTGYDLHIGITREAWSENATDPGLVPQATPQDPLNLAFCGDTGSVCSNDKNFCVASDVPGESLVSTLTKAVAIAMGATFNPSKGCSGDYILNELNETSSIGYLRFSSCDIQEIYATVFEAFSIPGSSKACITSFTDGEEQIVMEFGGFAGQELDGDKQCELALGPGASVSRTYYIPLGNYSSICYDGLVCVDDSNETTTISTLDGTQCGTNKVCQEGSCEEKKQDFDSIPDFCPFGDDPNTDCGDVNCLDPVTRFTCCEECKAGADSSGSSSDSTSKSSEEYAWVPGPHAPPNQDLPNGPYPGARRHTNMVQGPNGRKYFFSYFF